MPSVQTSSDAARADLSRRLRKLARVLDIERLRAQPLAATQVIEYYENCLESYRRHHSREGAVHMALNDGDRFDPDGFYGQVRRIEQAWPTAAPADVLELACGQGFNLAYLAARHPDVRFTGLDLTPAHLDATRSRVEQAGLRNVTLTLGDYHRLPYADASFDEVFCIEGLCHASDLPLALREIARVLRPGGRLTLFDGYLMRDPATLNADETLAIDLVAKGMAVEKPQQLQELLQGAAAAGLRTEVAAELDAQVMPSLRKIERLIELMIWLPWLGRRAMARRHPMRARNVLAGYLMRSTVALGLFGYRQLVLHKPG